MSYPRIIFCRLSQPALQRGWLAYGIVSERDGSRDHYRTPAAASFREAAGARDPGPASGVVTESTACGSPAAGEDAGEAEGNVASPAASARRQRGTRADGE
jgi:hypothetical protein